MVRGRPAGRVSRTRVVAAVAAALAAGAAALWATGLRDASDEGAQLAAELTGRAAAQTVPVPGASARPVSRGSGDGVGRTAASLPSAPAAVVAPTRLVAASIDLSLPVRPVGVAADGQMALPRTIDEAGWYRYGSTPGDRSGATVIAGHLDLPGQGTGELSRLRDLEKGDTVTLQVGSRTVRYVVRDVELVSKQRLDLAALFRRDGPPQLHLVTCGGRFDAQRRAYDDNVVVVAVPA